MNFRASLLNSLLFIYKSRKKLFSKVVLLALTLQFPARRGLFSFASAELMSTEKETSAMGRNSL